VAVVGASLVGAAFAGGWVSANHATPHASYTKGPAVAVNAKPAPPPAPAAFQAELERLAASYGEPVGISVSDVAQGWTASVAGDETFPQQSVS
jgi:beta-lactamase class A